MKDGIINGYHGNAKQLHCNKNKSKELL